MLTTSPSCTVHTCEKLSAGERIQEGQEIEDSQGGRGKGAKGRGSEGVRKREGEKQNQRGREREHRHDDIIGINEDSGLASPWIAK